MFSCIIAKWYTNHWTFPHDQNTMVNWKGKKQNFVTIHYFTTMKIWTICYITLQSNAISENHVSPK